MSSQSERTHIKVGIDRLDTGMPDQPNFDAIYRQGRTIRRRRQTLVGLGGAALAAAILVPAGVLIGQTTGEDDGVAVAQDPPSSTPPAPGGQPPASEAFGASMSARVTALFPGATQNADVIGDHYETTDAGTRRPAASDPIDWPHVFTWTQGFTLDGRNDLTISTIRTPEEDVDITKSCRGVPDDTQETCEVTDAPDGRTLLVHNGIKFADSGQFGVNVEVASDDGERGTASVINVWVVTTADHWEQAQDNLPDVETLTDLALDDNLILPAPTSYPSAAE